MRVWGIVSMIALATTVSACASTSAVVPMGNGIYMVSATSHGVLGGSGSEGADAAKAANDYCQSMGKHMVARNVSDQGPGLQAGVGLAITATVQFSCE